MYTIASGSTRSSNGANSGSWSRRSRNAAVLGGEQEAAVLGVALGEVGVLYLQGPIDISCEPLRHGVGNHVAAESETPSRQFVADRFWRIAPRSRGHPAIILAGDRAARRHAPKQCCLVQAVRT